MRSKMMAAVLLCATMLVGWGMAGCAEVLPLIPVPVSLGGTSASALDTTAGTPRTAKVLFESFDPTVTIGRGTLELDPSVISIGTNGVGKQILETLQQDAGVCLAACTGAQVPTLTCESVCNDGELIVTAWVGTADEVDTVCETGDQYGPYAVTLDESGQGISVSPSSITLMESTRDLLNGGSFSLCIEVISPVDGTVFIESIILNLGL